MANIFKPKRSGTASSVPTTTNLADGELAVNYTDQKIYLRNGASIIEVGNVAAGGGGLSNVVEDTTPQLGGDLDLNSSNITGTGNVNISGVATATSFSGNFSVTETSLNVSYYPLLVAGGTSGNKTLLVDNGGWSFNPSTNTLSTFNVSVSASLRLNDDVELNFGISNDAWFNYNGTGNYLELQLETAATDFRITDNGIERFKFDKSTGNLTLTGTVDGRDIATDGTKLDGIEANADVTDATNVAAAGAVMESDTTTVSMGFVIDEDTMVSNSATKVPTQQSVKAYVDANVGGGGGLANVVEDLTPQLGGNLDLNSSNITGTGNINTTGTITSTGNIQTDGAFRAESSNSTERFQIEYNETTDSLDFSYFAS